MLSENRTRFRVGAEVSKKVLQILDTVPRHSKNEIFKGLLNIFIMCNPDGELQENGLPKINWKYAQEIARGNFTLVRKETVEDECRTDGI